MRTMQARESAKSCDDSADSATGKRQTTGARRQARRPPASWYAAFVRQSRDTRSRAPEGASAMQCHHPRVGKWLVGVGGEPHGTNHFPTSLHAGRQLGSSGVVVYPSVRTGAQRGAWYEISKSRQTLLFLFVRSEMSEGARSPAPRHRTDMVSGKHVFTCSMPRRCVGRSYRVI